MKLALIALIFSAPSVFSADQSQVTVNRLQTPQKALQFAVIVPAKLEDVWTAFTTKTGLETWLWSDVSVELREGGDWTVHFPGGSTGGGTITAFTPQRQLVMRAMAPEQFPTVRRERTTAVFDFEPIGNQTRVTLTQSGWKEGQEWDDAYEYLAKGNAQLLEQLLYRFVKGPIDWKK